MSTAPIASGLPKIRQAPSGLMASLATIARCRVAIWRLRRARLMAARVRGEPEPLAMLLAAWAVLVLALAFG